MMVGMMGREGEGGSEHEALSTSMRFPPTRIPPLTLPPSLPPSLPP